MLYRFERVTLVTTVTVSSTIAELSSTAVGKVILVACASSKCFLQPGIPLWSNHLGTMQLNIHHDFLILKIY